MAFLSHIYLQHCLLIRSEVYVICSIIISIGIRSFYKVHTAIGLGKHVTWYKKNDVEKFINDGLTDIYGHKDN